MDSAFLSNLQSRYGITKTFPLLIKPKQQYINLIPIHVNNVLLRKCRAIFLISICLTFLPACATKTTLQKNDEWFSHDKYAHFLVSTAVAAGIAKAAKDNGRSDCDAARIGFALTISLGAAKESYDKRKRKTLYSYHDMVWNTAGSALGSLLGSGCR